MPSTFNAMMMMMMLLPCLLFVSSSRAAYVEADSKRYVQFASASYCPEAKIAAWSCIHCLPGSSFLGNLSSATADAFGYLAYDSTEHAIVLSFRGSYNIPNWIDDFEAVQTVPWYDHKTARVHAGFYKVFMSLQHQVITQVKAATKKYPTAKVVVTGHSLGAALSVLAAIDIYFNATVRVSSVYNYGDPRVGNQAFAQLYNSTISGQVTYRVINNADIVPHLPALNMGYWHVPSEIWYHGTSYKVCDNTGEDPSCSDSIKIGYDVTDHMTYMGVVMSSC
eukprot:TRINITY_DN2088_c0_g1_i2.p1 TRINITY_DN2088_c0_g1~~TRINITY_DN2088_c0_g1_i2.p1  ORF type:complete len:297 (+),score=51.60 TRINITY_DN2088_c0_g1_i2:56-892(+)